MIIKIRTTQSVSEKNRQDRLKRIALMLLKTNKDQDKKCIPISKSAL